MSVCLVCFNLPTARVTNYSENKIDKFNLAFNNTHDIQVQ